MVRDPITTTPRNVIKVHEELTVNDLFPKYSYQFEGLKEHEQATAMYASLQNFIAENTGLLPANLTNDYTQPFADAMAIVRLWMASLYLAEQERGENHGNTQDKGANITA